MTISDFVAENIDSSKPELPFPTSTKTVAKGGLITDYGQFEENVYFIQSGVMIVSLAYKEEDRILEFYFEGSFCASYSSLISNSPSDVRITAYTDVQLEVAKYADIQKAYETSLLANQLGRYATEQLLLDRVRREKELLTLTAQERYQSLLAKKPELVQQIAIKDLSKYLGVRPESLSRIRRN